MGSAIRWTTAEDDRDGRLSHGGAFSIAQYVSHDSSKKPGLNIRLFVSRLTRHSIKVANGIVRQRIPAGERWEISCFGQVLVNGEDFCNADVRSSGSNRARAE